MSKPKKNAGRVSRRSAWTTISEILGRFTDEEVVENVRYMHDEVGRDLRETYGLDASADVLSVLHENTVQVWDWIRTGSPCDESLFTIAWNCLARILDLCEMPEVRANCLVEGLIEYQALAVARDIEAGRV